MRDAEDGGEWIDDLLHQPFDSDTRFIDDLIAFGLATGATQEVVSDVTFGQLEADDLYLVDSRFADGSGPYTIEDVTLASGQAIPSIGVAPGRGIALQGNTFQRIDSRESGPFSRGPGYYSADLMTGTEVCLGPRGLPFTEVDALTDDVSAFTKDRPINGNPVQPALVSPKRGVRTTLRGPDGRNDVIQGVVVEGDRALVQYGPRSDLYLFDIPSETYTEIALGRGNLDATREVGLGADRAVYVNKLGQNMAFTVATEETFVVYDPRAQRSVTEAITVQDHLVVWNETYANGATAVRYAVILEPDYIKLTYGDTKLMVNQLPTFQLRLALEVLPPDVDGAVQAPASARKDVAENVACHLRPPSPLDHDLLDGGVVAILKLEVAG